jgi:hypothetical protein
MLNVHMKFSTITKEALSLYLREDNYETNNCNN